MPETLLLPIRHHGPGSARAVRRALAAWRPDVVLIEGPPEADALIPLAGSAGMRPPVALLAYSPVEVAEKRAAFWPFAEFSPEWQAIRWAVAHGVPVRFCDLPTAHRFADKEAEPEPESTENGTEVQDLSDVDVPAEAFHTDPLGVLAQAAGYDDPERWWEDVVEHRMPAEAGEVDEVTAALAPFAAITEAMAEVRTHAPEQAEDARVEEERREAYMRTTLRAARKEYDRIALVCGAWHAPALTDPLPPATADAKILKGLPKGKVAMAWVPWTHGRLASWQGYGAGVSSPGWYHHLFTAPDRPITRWLVGVGGVLRDEGLPVSSAHVIEAVRLAETLAVLRSRPLAGLAEVTEATRAILCDGDELKVELVNRRLVVGERLGEVPDDAPVAPLAADVAAAQKKLRMPPSALVSELELDLRREIDLNRSRLLHRLRLLGVAWGQPGHKRGKGTFWEAWQLCWQPEFAVDLIAASGYGTTVVAAATAKTAELAGAAPSLAALTELVEACLLADLGDAFPTVLAAVRDRAALDADVAHLMSALPSLARTLRYGDVRGTDVSALATVADGLLRRVFVGLPGAATALDDDAAAELRNLVDGVHQALGLLDNEPANGSTMDEWLAVLGRLATRDDIHPLLAGRLNRLLVDGGRLDVEEAGRRLGLILTIGVEPAHAARWVEGFLAGGGLLLVHDDRLLGLIDSWLAAIPADTFTEVLPLLRRTFGAFEAPERRAIGEKAKTLTSGGPARIAIDDEVPLDPDRAARPLPTLALLLGKELAEATS